MVQLVLTPEQIRVVLSARSPGTQEPISVVDVDGIAVGQLMPPRSPKQHFTAAQIAAIEARSGKDGPYLTTAEMLAELSQMSASRCDSP